MLKKLRRKILVINMSLVSIVLLLAMAFVCAFSYHSASQELYRSLRMEVEMDTQENLPPAQLGQQTNPPDHPVSVLHINAVQTENGTWDIQHSEEASIEPDSLVQALVRIQASEKDEGLLTDLRLGYVRRVTDEGLLLVLGDSSSVRVTMWNTVLTCAAVSLGSILVFFFISLGLSNMAVKPIEQAWRQQKQFVADASHELKTPLTVILANNNIISSHQTETVAQQEPWLRATAEEAEQMRQLLDEMLTLARADDEQAVIDLHPINVSEQLEEEVLFLEPIAYEKNVTLEARIEKDLILASDPRLLKKLAVILIDNAIKHGSAGTTVTVTLSGGKLPFLSVHNFGPAIAPEDLPHLFDRFYRSDKSRSTEGYGLGLAIANAIAGKLKSKLSVTSTEEEGTTFTVEFKG